MRGEIISSDPVSGDGLISGDDGARYSFTAADASGATARTGDRVDFVAVDGAATQIVVLSPVTSPGGQAAASGPWAGQTGTSQTGTAQTGAPRSLNDPAPAGVGFEFGTALFSFNGRLRRSHFWIGWGILFGTGFVLNYIPFFGLLGIFLIWPHLAIGMKRLHDMGKSGWLLAIPYGINTVLFCAAAVMLGIAMQASGNSPEYYENDPMALISLMGPAIGVFGLSFLVGLAFLLWIGIADSQRGANKYGSNPKGE